MFVPSVSTVPNVITVVDLPFWLLRCMTSLPQLRMFQLRIHVVLVCVCDATGDSR